MYGKAVTRFLPASRNRLTEYSFVRLETGVWELALPALYAELFELHEQVLFQKAQQGWQDRSEQDGKKICHCNFTDTEVNEVRKFLADFG